MSGHTVNALLKCGNDLSTLNVLSAICNIANVHINKACDVITKGRNFIIDQIKNQGKPKLLKGSFFKDISDAKSWHRIRLSLSVESSEPTSNDQPNQVPFKLKKISSTNDTSLKPVRKADEMEKTSVTIPKVVDKPSRSSSDNLKSHKDSKMKKLTPNCRKSSKDSTSVKARRSSTHKSVLPCDYALLEIPDEKDFDYICPRCGLRLCKSMEFPKLLPRIQAHILEHGEKETNSKRRLNDNQSEDFLKRHMSFIKYVEELEDEPCQIDYFQFPKKKCLPISNRNMK
jgi:hypothetical protein